MIAVESRRWDASLLREACAVRSRIANPYQPSVSLVSAPAALAASLQTAVARVAREGGRGAEVLQCFAPLGAGDVDDRATVASIKMDILAPLYRSEKSWARRDHAEPTPRLLGLGILAALRELTPLIPHALAATIVACTQLAEPDAISALRATLASDALPAANRTLLGQIFQLLARAATQDACDALARCARAEVVDDWIERQTVSIAAWVGPTLLRPALRGKETEATSMPQWLDAMRTLVRLTPLLFDAEPAALRAGAGEGIVLPRGTARDAVRGIWRSLPATLDPIRERMAVEGLPPLHAALCEAVDAATLGALAHAIALAGGAAALRATAPFPATAADHRALDDPATVGAPAALRRGDIEGAHTFTLCVVIALRAGVAELGRDATVVECSTGRVVPGVACARLSSPLDAFAPSGPRGSSATSALEATVVRRLPGAAAQALERIAIAAVAALSDDPAGAQWPLAAALHQSLRSGMPASEALASLCKRALDAEEPSVLRRRSSLVEMSSASIPLPAPLDVRSRRGSEGLTGTASPTLSTTPPSGSSRVRRTSRVRRASGALLGDPCGEEEGATMAASGAGEVDGRARRGSGVALPGYAVDQLASPTRSASPRLRRTSRARRASGAMLGETFFGDEADAAVLGAALSMLEAERDVDPYVDQRAAAAEDTHLRRVEMCMSNPALLGLFAQLTDLAQRIFNELDPYGDGYFEHRAALILYDRLDPDTRVVSQETWTTMLSGASAAGTEGAEGRITLQQWVAWVKTTASAQCVSPSAITDVHDELSAIATELLLANSLTRLSMGCEDAL